MIDLSGKSALITGASKGIGKAAAIIFAEAGAKTVVCARSEAELMQTAKEIEGKGGAALPVVCDVSDRKAMEGAVEACVKTHGGIDILVNNAAVIGPIAKLAEADPEEWGAAIDINVKGVAYASAAALRHMKNGGTILTVGSGAAGSALLGWTAYCASKAAVHHLNRCMHEEYSHMGVRAMILSPGTVATDMQRQVKESGVNPVSQLPWEAHIPPEWPGRALLWMCSGDSDSYLGQVVSLSDPGVRARIGLG